MIDAENLLVALHAEPILEELGRASKRNTLESLVTVALVDGELILFKSIPHNQDDQSRALLIGGLMRSMLELNQLTEPKPAPAKLG